MMRLGRIWVDGMSPPPPRPTGAYFLPGQRSDMGWQEEACSYMVSPINDAWEEQNHIRLPIWS